MDVGPELLYRTRHRVIGKPYHRNGDGIFDGYRILATTDFDSASAAVDERRIDLVLLCRSTAERAFYEHAEGEENLYTMLENGAPPTWLLDRKSKRLNSSQPYTHRKQYSACTKQL